MTHLLCNWKFVPLSLSHLFLSSPTLFFRLLSLLCFLAQNTSQAHLLLSQPLPWNHLFLQIFLFLKKIFLWGIVFRTKNWVSDMFIATRVSLLLSSFSWQSKNHELLKNIYIWKNSNTTNSNSTNTTRFLSFYICIFLLPQWEPWFSITAIYICAFVLPYNIYPKWFVDYSPIMFLLARGLSLPFVKKWIQIEALPEWHNKGLWKPGPP